MSRDQSADDTGQNVPPEVVDHGQGKQLKNQ